MTLDTAIATLEPLPAAYVLQSSTGDYVYKGRNLRKRLTDHRAGRVRHTKNRRPLTLFHFEYQPDFSSARKRENWLKSGIGREFLRRLLEDLPA